MTTIKKKILFTFFTALVTILLPAQDVNCKLNIDEIKQGDTLEIAIKNFVNRNESKEQVLIYMNEFNQYCAILNSDEIKQIKIELTMAEIEIVRMFEIGVRSQELKRNQPIHIHSLAEYEIIFRSGKVSYFTREVFYSLAEDLMR